MNYLLLIDDATDRIGKLPMGDTIYDELIGIKNTIISKSTNLNDFADEVYPKYWEYQNRFKLCDWEDYIEG